MKTLIILLNDDKNFTHISYNSTKKAINNEVDIIITPNVEFFSTAYINKYNVYVYDGENYICLNELVENKRVRYTQNASKMLLCGVFTDLGIHVERFGEF